MVQQPHRSRGVEFPQPSVEQSFGWWSMFEDQEGNWSALRGKNRGKALVKVAEGRS